MVEDVLNQQRPDTNVGKRLFKDIPEDQVTKIRNVIK